MKIYRVTLCSSQIYLYICCCRTLVVVVVPPSKSGNGRVGIRFHGNISFFPLSLSLLYNASVWVFVAAFVWRFKNPNSRVPPPPPFGTRRPTEYINSVPRVFLSKTKPYGGRETAARQSYANDHCRVVLGSQNNNNNNNTSTRPRVRVGHLSFLSCSFPPPVGYIRQP